jgi:hypothetical protein
VVFITPSSRPKTMWPGRPIIFIACSVLRKRESYQRGGKSFDLVKASSLSARVVRTAVRSGGVRCCSSNLLPVAPISPQRRLRARAVKRSPYLSDCEPPVLSCTRCGNQVLVIGEKGRTRLSAAVAAGIRRDVQGSSQCCSAPVRAMSESYQPRFCVSSHP